MNWRPSRSRPAVRDCPQPETPIRERAFTTQQLAVQHERAEWHDCIQRRAQRIAEAA